MTKRLLHPSDLPASLWREGNDGCLYVPRSIRTVYERLLSKKGLLETARSDEDSDGPVGGVSEKDTRKHFATRFSTSAARTQLALLDPRDELKNASDLFLQSFSGGRVGLLDIPSGAGAASVDLLATVAALREAGLVPRQPLEVCLVAGDISAYAQDYAREMIEGLDEALRLQGIFVRPQFNEWDVLNTESTTSILHSWMDWARDCNEHFVVMANFSGFLQGNGKFKKAQPQLDEVFRWAAERRSTVMWLEPQTNKATKSLLPRIKRWFEKKLPRLFSTSWDKADGTLTTGCRYLHPIKADCRPRVSLSLIRLEANEA